MPKLHQREEATIDETRQSYGLPLDASYDWRSAGRGDIWGWKTGYEEGFAKTSFAQHYRALALSVAPNGFSSVTTKREKWFNFSMSGSARWKPTRVYTDGTKTYIQFPGQLGSGDAPVLYVVS